LTNAAADTRTRRRSIADVIAKVLHRYFGATDHEVDDWGLFSNILSYVFDLGHAGGCECARLRAAVYLEKVAENELVAVPAFWHSRPECPAVSQDEWLEVQGVSRA